MRENCRHVPPPGIRQIAELLLSAVCLYDVSVRHVIFFVLFIRPIISTPNSADFEQIKDQFNEVGRLHSDTI